MTGLTLALNSALSGLNVNQQALAVLSQNIANANTAGYSRQIVNQQAVYIDGQGQGVSIGTPPAGIGKMRTEAIEVTDSPDLPPLWHVFGGSRRDDGHWAGTHSAGSAIGVTPR